MAKGFKHSVKRSPEQCAAISARMIGNKNGIGHKCSPETRALMRSSAKRGAESNFWRGGRTDEAKLAKSSAEYRQWREAVFRRDWYTCQICGEYGGKLHADHIKRFSAFPELRFEVSNGRTLCVACHKQTPTYGRNKALESPTDNLLAER